MARVPAATAPLGRCCAVWAAGSTALAALLGWLLPDLVTRLAAAPGGFDALLVTGCEAVAVGVAVRVWFLLTLLVREARGGSGPVADARGPRLLRTLVLAGCGLSVAGGLLAPAGADPAGLGRTTTSAVLVGLPVPDRLPATPHPSRVRGGPRRPPVQASARPRPEPTVVVASGDTLWGLAAATLPPAADDRAVDRRWHEIYRANRDLVGPDPHLILPGQRLVLPTRPDPGEE